MDQFNLNVITLAYRTQIEAGNAFDALTAEMLCWHEAECYPEPADIVAALKEADIRNKHDGKPLSVASLKTYASGILAWAKSGKTPGNIRTMTLSRPDGHVKGKGGRPSKAKAMDIAPVALSVSTPAANDSQEHPRKIALASLNNIQAIRTTLGVPMGTDFQAFEDHLCALIAILRAVKP